MQRRTLFFEGGKEKSEGGEVFVCGGRENLPGGSSILRAESFIKKAD